MNIILVGFMGSGKSTLGRELAAALNFTFIETDAFIEHSEKKNIPQIFKIKGEEYFRNLESETLHQLKLLVNCVIATGGGMPCFNNNMQLINQLGLSVWLDVDEKELIRRLENETNNRPKISQFGSAEKTVLELLPHRKPYYQKSKVWVSDPTLDGILSAIEIFKQKD